MDFLVSVNVSTESDRLLAKVQFHRVKCSKSQNSQIVQYYALFASIILSVQRVNAAGCNMQCAPSNMQYAQHRDSLLGCPAQMHQDAASAEMGEGVSWMD